MMLIDTYKSMLMYKWTKGIASCVYELGTYSTANSCGGSPHGDPDVDVSYQWLRFFEEDDGKLDRIYNDYKSGKLLSGELKELLIDKLNAFLKRHQAARKKAEKSVDKFIFKEEPENPA